jgi:hypothetical protein
MSALKIYFKTKKAPNGYSTIVEATGIAIGKISCAGHDEEDAYLNLIDSLNDVLEATKKELYEISHPHHDDDNKVIKVF